MAKPVSLSNTFAAQAGPIPLVQLDQNFTALVNAVNDPATYQNYAVDTGAANAYAVAPSPAWTVYTAGMAFQFKAANANTTASTLNISSLGVKTIKTISGSDLSAGAIPAGGIVSVQYDGTNFQMLSAIPSTSNYTVKEVTDTTDIALVDIASSYSTMGSPVTVTIPTSGFIRMNFSGRLLDTSGSGCIMYSGIRVNGVNYWFGDYNNNGTITHNGTILSTASQYREVQGLIGQTFAGTSYQINIAASGMATGSQSVQPIVSRAANAGTLKGATTTSRIMLEFISVN